MFRPIMRRHRLLLLGFSVMVGISVLSCVYLLHALNSFRYANRLHAVLRKKRLVSIDGVKSIVARTRESLHRARGLVHNGLFGGQSIFTAARAF